MGDQRSIPESFIRDYVDKLLEIAAAMQPSSFRDAIVLRADNLMDLVEAYRDRNKPRPPV